MNKRIKDIGPTFEIIIIYRFLDEIRDNEWFPTLFTLAEIEQASPIETFAPYIDKLSSTTFILTLRFEQERNNSSTGNGKKKPSKDEERKKRQEEQRRRCAGKPG